MNPSLSADQPCYEVVKKKAQIGHCTVGMQPNKKNCLHLLIFKAIGSRSHIKGFLSFLIDMEPANCVFIAIFCKILAYIRDMCLFHYASSDLL